MRGDASVAPSAALVGEHERRYGEPLEPQPRGGVPVGGLGQQKSCLWQRTQHSLQLLLRSAGWAELREKVRAATGRPAHAVRALQAQAVSPRSKRGHRARLADGPPYTVATLLGAFWLVRRGVGARERVA